MKNPRILFSVILVLLLLPAVNGQTISRNAVIANWNFTLNDDVKPETAEEFILTQYIPAFEKVFLGINIFLVKSDRGTNEGSYSLLLVFKSIEHRNEWWPEKGESSEKGQKASQMMTDHAEKLDSMISMDSWNDWLVK